MTSQEFAAARTALGQTVEATSADFNVTPAVVQAWESGALAIPRRIADQLARRAMVHERRAALDASGLPVCPWVTEHHAAAKTGDARAQLRYVNEATKHVAQCPVCQAREKFISANFPSLPAPPASGTVRALSAVIQRVRRMPAWARPAAYGGLVVGGLVFVRAALIALAGGPSWRLAEVVGLAILAGVYIGGVGGIVYALVRPRLLRYGRTGDYLTGIACVYGYLLAAVPIGLFGSPSDWRDPVLWVVVASVGAGFGVLIGHMWFRRLS
jgi:hypothetical protein